MMKLLFDQNFSFRILKKLDPYSPKCSQVCKVGLEGSSDKQVWKYAKSHFYTIVTYDGYFCDIAALKGHPPKIIWLRTGNLNTESIAKRLIRKSELIIDFIDNAENKAWACLEII